MHSSSSSAPCDQNTDHRNTAPWDQSTGCRSSAPCDQNTDRRNSAPWDQSTGCRNPAPSDQNTGCRNTALWDQSTGNQFTEALQTAHNLMYSVSNLE